jgi:hypothetical protein
VSQGQRQLLFLVGAFVAAPALGLLAAHGAWAASDSDRLFWTWLFGGTALLVIAWGLVLRAPARAIVPATLFSPLFSGIAFAVWFLWAFRDF